MLKFMITPPPLDYIFLNGDILLTPPQPCKKYGSTVAELAARLESCRQVHLLWLVKSYITKKKVNLLV